MNCIQDGRNAIRGRHQRGPCAAKGGLSIDRTRNRLFAERERGIYDLIARNDGLKAKEIAEKLHLPREEVNRELYLSPLMRELCYQDREYRWHALIRRAPRHEGLYEFSGYYSTVQEFLDLDEEAWMTRLTEGCTRIGRNLNDTRGLFHSFRDCRQVMRNLFADLETMTDGAFRDWEIVFEFRLNRGRYIRIYADVLLITRQRVFSLEFKMKDRIEPSEVLQAAKYVPYLEIAFGPDYDVIPALILTGAADLYTEAPIGDTDAILPVASGDMLFNVLDAYLGFLS